jgi:hypothetical protein
MKIKLNIIFCAFIFITGFFACNSPKTPDNQVIIDFDKEIEEFQPLGAYLNNSIRHCPPPELGSRIEEEFGKPLIMRCWLTLDDMWDYRTDTYNFNFQVGLDTYKNDTVKHQYDRKRVTETPYLFEEYLKSFGDHSETLLLNIRRYEHEVINNIITIDKWKEIVKTGLKHYKELCPNLRYIEVLNESQNDHFGGLDDKQYYQFYKAAYEVVNELNKEFSPDMPLEVGGPTASGKPLHLTDHKQQKFERGNKAQQIYRFIKHFSEDESADKRLDFISFHEYGLKNNPAVLLSYESIINNFLNEFNLSDDLPLFLDEIGVDPPKTDPAFNLEQACGMTTFYNYSRKLQNLIIFPWVTYHFPGQRSLVMFDENLKLTSFGMAVKMMQLHNKTEVESISDNIDEKGIGVHSIATKSENNISVQVWNFNDKPDSVTVYIKNLPDKMLDREVTVTKYLIDSENNNLAGGGDGEKLLYTEKYKLKGRNIRNFKTFLEPYALCLYRIE